MMISFQEFKKLEIKVATIKEVKDHPKADKLYLLKIDTGSAEKQIVAGIKKSYQPNDLVGKQIVLVDNLEPASIRGEMSQGMLLAVEDEQGISIIIPERKVKVGSSVK